MMFNILWQSLLLASSKRQTDRFHFLSPLRIYAALLLHKYNLYVCTIIVMSLILSLTCSQNVEDARLVLTAGRVSGEAEERAIVERSQRLVGEYAGP